MPVRHVEPSAPILATLVALIALALGSCAAPSGRDDPSPQPENGVDGVVSYTVQRGDRLADIAREFTGDMTLWRDIAAHNGIDDPRTLREGAVLRIPTALIPDHASQAGERAAGQASTDQASTGQAGTGGAGRDAASADAASADAEATAAPSASPSTLGVRRAGAAGTARPTGEDPVTLTPVVVNRSFELSPLGETSAETERGRRIQVIGSYFPKGVYAQPAIYSKLLMRVAPGTLFELDREIGDWYGIVTEDGEIGYLRDVDGRVLGAS